MSLLRKQLLFACISFSVVACKRQALSADRPYRPVVEAPKGTVVGKWQETTGDREVLEFFSEGTVQGSSARIHMFIGKYSILDATRIKLELTMGGNTGQFIFTYKLSRSELILTDQNGDVTTYLRVN